MYGIHPQNSAFAFTGKHPLTAALLSLFPGWGQLYVGEKRKGILFIMVAIANASLCAFCLNSSRIYAYLNAVGPSLHMKLNSGFASVLTQLKPGTPASLLLFAAAAAFTLYCARDAYDRAFFARIGPLYKSFVLDLSEANSFSYLLHFSLWASLLVLALFFIAEPPRIDQTTEIFIDTDALKIVKKIPITSNVSTRAGESHGHLPRNNDSHAAGQPTKSKSDQAQHHQVTKPPAPAPLPPRPTHAMKPAPLPRPVAQNSAVARAPSPAHPTQAVPATSQPTQPVRSAALIFQKLLPPSTAVPVPATSKVAPPMQPTLIATAPAAAGSPSAPLPIAVNSSASFIPRPTIIGHGAGTPASPALPNVAIGMMFNNERNAQPLPVEARSASDSSVPTPQAVHTSSPGSASGKFPTAPAPVRASIGNPEPHFAFAPRTGRPGADSTTSASSGNDDKPKDIISKPVDFGRYMADLQRRIKRHWQPPKSPHSHITVLTFQVLSDGTVSNLRVEHTCGSATEDNAAVQAVEDSAPLPPLPQGAPASVDIEFTFTYDVFGHTDTGFRRF